MIIKRTTLRPHIIIYFLIVFSFSHCKDIKSGKSFNAIVVDVDSSKSKYRNDLFEAYPNFTQKVNLPSIQNGVDSFEYRIWAHVNADLINLIRIRYDSTSWIITETIISSHIPNKSFNRIDTANYLLNVIVDSTKTIFIKPKISIDDFIDSLQIYNLEQAPSNIQIERSVDLGTDAWNYTIELADKNNYRIIMYSCPGNIKSLHQFHNSFRSFLDFIRVSLNTKFTPC